MEPLISPIGNAEQPPIHRPNVWRFHTRGIWNRLESGSHHQRGAGFPRSDVMSDTLGDALQNVPPSPPPPPPGDDEVINLFDGSAEPTDDSPTIISKTAPQTSIRTEEQFGGGLARPTPGPF